MEVRVVNVTVNLVSVDQSIGNILHAIQISKAELNVLINVPGIVTLCFIASDFNDLQSEGGNLIQRPSLSIVSTGVNKDFIILVEQAAIGLNQLVSGVTINQRIVGLQSIRIASDILMVGVNQRQSVVIIVLVI